VQSAKCKVQSAKRRVQSAECETKAGMERSVMTGFRAAAVTERSNLIFTSFTNNNNNLSSNVPRAMKINLIYLISWGAKK